MFNNFTILTSMVLFFISCNIHASANEDWNAYEKLVIEKCIAASNLDNAKPAGEILLYDDSVGFDALLLRGTNPQYQTKAQAGSELCLFNKVKQTASVSDASYLIKKKD